MKIRIISALLACALLMTACQSVPVEAADTSRSGAEKKALSVSEKQENTFVTLGTAAGPNGQITRAQPANALLVGDDLYLVDAGDGAVGQLKKAGLSVEDVHGLFISHNHFDHTGGVLAVLGLRMQLNVHNTLAIYGPPGTQEFIDGVLEGMELSREAAYGMPGQSWVANIKVNELVDGSLVELKGVKVKVAENTHFKIPGDGSTPEKAKSLSYRFDLKDRSIVYTGDTGPSKAVEKLAEKADILISEMMDIPKVVKLIRRENPKMPQVVLDRIEWHFRAHHLLPIQVGELAASAGVTRVVVTHMAPNISNEAMADGYRAEIAKAFKGDIDIADDLDRF